ncbi:MAG: hypothetical protein P4L03_08050 [Terracidiphilus sp.]|nr:hypothetical protein [Terracidiphilus sp.]
METVCHRCHRAVPQDSSFCPFCGLPHLVYETEHTAASGQLERPGDEVCDAGSVNWLPVLRLALALAIPAGILSNFLGILGPLLMAFSAASVVLLYMRGRRPAWITMGAGARIGMVTGFLGGWSAIATAGIGLFVMRFWLHQGRMFDDFWMSLVGQQVPAQFASAGLDVQAIAAQRASMLTPDGQAGWTIGIFLVLSAVLLFFGTVGGAMGARLAVRARRSQF